MGLPLSFLAGLAVLFVHRELDDSLPGQIPWPSLWIWSPIIVVPWLTAVAATRIVDSSLRTGTPRPSLLRALLAAQTLTVPVSYAALVIGGGLPLVVFDIEPDLQVVQLAVLIAPLLLMELSMRLTAYRAARLLELAGITPPAQLGPDRLAMIVLIVLPLLLLGAGADLLAIDRRLEVFSAATSLGTTLSLAAAILVLCVVLPVIVRYFFPVSATIPAPVGDHLRDTATQLGFPRRAVLWMRTRHRIVNAALVGPLPWPRYLVITDGLIALLDLEALRGVVAHEIGHARANHPAFLVVMFAGFPLLLLQPGQLVLADLTLSPLGWSAVAGGATLLVVVILRGIAHRFEYEADQLSAEALGDPSACIRALRRVAAMSPRGPHRASLRHPSEVDRVLHLRACARDPVLRARFWRRGRYLRRSVYVGLTIALACFVWAQSIVWPLDRAVYLFYSGSFTAARAQLDALSDDLPPDLAATARELRQEVDASLELGIEGPWHEIRERLAERALQRAEVVFATDGPEEALPWLSLALARDRPPAWLQSLYLYCRAVRDGDEAFARRVAAHTLTLAPPRPFADALRARQ